MLATKTNEYPHYYEFYGDLFDLNSNNKTKTVCHEHCLCYATPVFGAYQV